MNFNAMSDDELLSIFSDCYKDANGFRPRHFSREYAVEWLTRESSEEAQARRRAEWEEEENWIVEMEKKWKAEQDYAAPY